MSTVILPSRHTTQARGQVEIDNSNPLAKDLIAAYNLTSYQSGYLKDSSGLGQYNGGRSSVGKFPYTLHGYYVDGSSEVPLLFTPEGQVFDFNGTNSRRAVSSAFPATSTSGALRTYITRVYLRDTTTKQIILGHFNSGLSPLHLYGSGLYVNSGTLYGVGASNDSKAITASAPSTNQWVTIALVAGTTDGRMYINGQLVASGDLNSSGVSYLFGIGCDGQNAYGTGGGSAFLNGMVGATLIYQRALSESEIQRLSSNPYQIIKSKRRLFVDAIAASTSPVSTTVDLLFNVVNSVSQARTIDWNIRNSTTSGKDVEWGINTSAQETQSFTHSILNSTTEGISSNWNIQVSVTTDKNFDWNTLSSTSTTGDINWNIISSVTDTQNVLWSIQNSVSVNNPIAWDILNATSKSLVNDWVILQNVNSAKSIDWNILSDVLNAQKTLDIRYDLLASVYENLSCNWNTLTNTIKNATVDWGIHNAVENPKSILWGITNNVAQDLILTSSILGISSKDLTIHWDSAGVVENSLVVHYSISGGTSAPITRLITIRRENRVISLTKQNRIITLSKQNRIITL